MREIIIVSYSGLFVDIAIFQIVIPESSMDIVYGLLFYRLLVTGDPLEDEDVEHLVSLAFFGIEAK